MPKTTKGITTLTGLDIQPNIETNDTNVHACYVPTLTVAQRDSIAPLRSGGIICLPTVSVQLGYYFGGTHHWVSWALV